MINWAFVGDCISHSGKTIISPLKRSLLLLSAPTLR